MSATLTNEEYDQRKRFLEDLKLLSKTEHAKLFEILRSQNAEYSENSNGVFFDISKVSSQVFKEMNDYMEYCSQVRKEQADRDEDEKRAQDLLMT